MSGVRVSRAAVLYQFGLSMVQMWVGAPGDALLRGIHLL